MRASSARSWRRLRRSAARTWWKSAPGSGAITRELLAALGTMQVVELDRDLAKALPTTCWVRANWHQANALDFDFHRLATCRSQLAHHRQSALQHLHAHLPLTQADVIADMTFMLQKEVVERMVVAPQTFSRLWPAFRHAGGLRGGWVARCTAGILQSAPQGGFPPWHVAPYSTPRCNNVDEKRLQAADRRLQYAPQDPAQRPPGARARRNSLKQRALIFACGRKKWMWQPG